MKGIAILLSVVLIFSVFTLTPFMQIENDQTPYGTGLIISDAEYPQNGITSLHKGNETINLYKELSPESLDLSQSSPFPPVISQGSQASCVSFALTYYAYSYLQEYSMSPAFTYNMANGGTDYGSSFSTTIKILEDWGSCSYDLMPYDPSDYISWGNEYAFLDTINQIPVNGVSVAFSGQTVIDDIKYLLMDDALVCISFDAGQYDNGFEDGNYIISSEEYDSNTVNHAQTIVGYNDGITDDGDIGAFRVVNSWGSSWADDGFYWLTYDAFNEILLKVYYYLIPQTNYDNQTYLEIRFSVTPSRERFSVNGDTKWYATDTLHQLPNALYIRIDSDTITLDMEGTEIIGILSSLIIHKSGLRSSEADNLPLQNPFTITNSFDFSSIETQECEVG